MKITFAKDEKKKNPLLEKGKELVEKIKHLRLPNSFYYFLLLIAISVGFYMLMLVQNDFSLAYGGDYSAQYIPMGYHIWDYYHEWIKTGHFTLFDQSIYLGVNSIGSNSYYGLFSPFNILIIIFPRSIVPQMVAISSIIKLSCAGFFFSIYVRKAFGVKENISYIAGIAYGFAGWGAFYIWYNNYQDILVFFPVILLGIEKTIQQKKPWILALGVFFLTICNYVLMVPYIICAFLYAMFRFFQTMRTRDVKENFIVLGLGVAGFAGGLLMSMFVFGPAISATLASPKLDENSYGGLLKEYLSKKDFKNFFETLFSWKHIDDQHRRVITARAYYPIIEFFFPPVTCRTLPTLEIDGWDFDDMAVSLWCYVPMIMFLVPALIQSGKEKKWSHYIAFTAMVLFLFTPFMYFVTMAFSNGYARWTLFVPACLVAYVTIYLDKIPNVAKWHIHVGFDFAVAGIVLAWVMTYKLTGEKILQFYNKGYGETGKFIRRFANKDFDYTNIAFIIELVYTTTVYLVLFLLQDKKRAFTILATVFVSVEAIAVGNFVTYGHGYDEHHNNGYAQNDRFKKLLNKIEKDDKSFYRMYASIGDGYSTNNGMLNDYSTASFFHSLYNFEVNDFTLWTALRDGDKSVGGTYRGKWQDLDNSLGVKYYIISKEKSKYNQIISSYPNGYQANVPFDFVEKKEYETDEYQVYYNDKLNDFGHAYSTINQGELTKTRYGITPVNNSIALNKEAYVSKEDAVEIQKNSNGIIVNESNLGTSGPKQLTQAMNYDYNIYHIHIPGTDPNKDYVQWAKNYDFSKIATIPETPETCTKIDSTDFDSSEALKYFGVYTAKVADQPLVNAGTTLYVRADYGDNKRYDFYFVTKDDNGEYKTFMMDSHDDETTDTTSSMRGFYLTKDVYRIVVLGKFYKSYVTIDNFSLYSEDIAAYRLRRDAFKADPVTDVTYTKDKFTFKTNYASNKFVVSYVAYDVGWKIKATNNVTKKTVDIKTYKGNGAFVSFIAPIGDYSYEMVYETPYLALSYLASMVGFTTFFVSILAYHLYQEKKKNHYLDGVYRNLY